MSDAKRRHYIIAARQQQERDLRAKIALEVDEFCEERHSPVGQHCDCASIAHLIENHSPDGSAGPTMGG
jgi:hypothetical protein